MWDILLILQEEVPQGSSFQANPVPVYVCVYISSFLDPQIGQRIKLLLQPLPDSCFSPLALLILGLNVLNV